MSEIIFQIGHIVLGLYFMITGIMHFVQSESIISFAERVHVPLADVFVYTTGMLLIVSGILLVLWWNPIFAVLFTMLFLGVTAFWAHGFWRFSKKAEQIEHMRYFFSNLALCSALAIILSSLVQLY